jgi:hypothetical protein
MRSAVRYFPGRRILSSGPALRQQNRFPVVRLTGILSRARCVARSDLISATTCRSTEALHVSAVGEQAVQVVQAGARRRHQSLEEISVSDRAQDRS